MGHRGAVGRRVLWVGAALAAALSALPVLPSAAAGGHCARMNKLTVPRAEHFEAACLDDMTTEAIADTTYTDASDWATLHSKRSENPSGVPGIQIDGYFPDTSTFNTYRSWNHDSQFVIRLPDEWNGKLVVTGAPGVRKQYANDFIISDWVIARGYAFASTDKGNSGTSFYDDGERPGDAVLEWHRRVRQLTKAAKAVVEQRYGRAPRRTYMTGISNGGYLTRWQLERYPKLYDGGVDWEGTLLQAGEPNLFTYLPAALRNYPQWQATGDEQAYRNMIDAGFEPGSEVVWPDHYAVYWDLTQRVYREEFDPDFDGDQKAGYAFCQPGSFDGACDADYDYASRPQAVKDAMQRVSLTGNIRRRMLTLHGTLDALLPIDTDSHIYRRMVRAGEHPRKHRYYVIEDGTHVDGLADAYPEQLRPILPCYRAAFVALERWVERDRKPPRSHFVERPASGDLANECDL